MIRPMIDSLVHRGPDAQGLWVDERRRCVLGHRRLSIIDTSDAGRQPMMSGDGQWVIAFNGEIYNFLEIRAQLEAKGVRFHGRTDTEVLLESVAFWGIEALPKLDGMFAVAAFNRRSGEVIIARDAFGEKPLYYVELPGGGLAFGSELQALEKLPNFNAEVSLDAMAEVLMFQYIGAPRTIYRSVKKLPPGHWMRLVPDQPPAIGRFFEFRPGAGGFDSRPLATLVDELEDILLRSIRRRLISDVPLGAFLSGGVDSSTVCALIRNKLGLPLKTFSIGFRHAPESEHEAARLLAKHIGADHRDRVLSPDTSAFLSGIGRVLDEPNGDSSCMPTYLLAEFARREVTVAVSGDGGDELFAGYGRYFSTLEEERVAARGPGWHPGHAYYSDRILVSTEKYVEELFGEVPAGLARHLRRLRDELADAGLPLFCRLRRTDVENYLPGAVLPKVDRMSMQHSLEVRTPYLNMELARFAERLPLDVLYQHGRGKLLLRELASRYLPSEIVDAPKKGFGLPMSRWARDPLLAVASSLLEGEESRLRQALGVEALGRFMARQRSRDGFSTYQVWALAMLESWLRHHPARLHDATESLQSGSMRLGARKRSTARSLFAWPIEEGYFGVIEDPEPTQEQASGTVDLSPTQLPIRLSRKGAPVLPETVTERARLRGAKLLFLGQTDANPIDHDLIEVCRRLGIREIEYVHPYMPDRYRIRMRLRCSSWIKRMAAAWWLRRRAIGRFRWGQRLGIFIQIVRWRGLHGQPLRFGPLSHVACEPNQEMSHRFMLFEGVGQLSPVPIGHAELAQRGRGGYSVWNSHVYFMPTRLRWLLSCPYWAVERTPETECRLQYVCDLIQIGSQGQRDLSMRLRKWLSEHQHLRRPSRPPEPGSVVIMTHALPPGGAERQWCYLAIGLKGRGFNVHFVVTNSIEGKDGHYRGLLEKNGISIISLQDEPAREGLASNDLDKSVAGGFLVGSNPFGDSALRLLALLRRVNPQAVFAQLDYPNLLAGVAGLLADVPKVVLSFRNYNPTHFSYLANDWFLDYYRTVIGTRRVTLTGNSHAANDDYAKWLNVDRSAIAWIPNAIDEEDFLEPSGEELSSLRAELGIGREMPVVLGVFRLSEEKEPLLFLDVCARLLAAIPSLRVLVAGVGPMCESMQSRIERLGLGNRVSLLGRRDDVTALMRISTLLLLTSSREGMPNVLMEAQLQGIPVVATRVGGVPDCVQHGVTGFVEDVGDVEALVRACTRLLQDQEYARSMGHAGAAWMRAFFTKSKMAARFAEVAEVTTPNPIAVDA